MMKGRPALANRAILSFKAYDIKTENERYQQMDHYWSQHPLPGHPSVPRWADSLNTDSSSMPGTFVRNYAFEIDTMENVRIADFDNIVQLSRKRGWRLVFNLLAEDVEWAERLAGSDLTDLMHANAALLEEYYTRKGVVVVNNLDAVPDSLFRDRDWTTEHYLQQGRQIIADKVAEALRAFYPTAYQP